MLAPVSKRVISDSKRPTDWIDSDLAGEPIGIFRDDNRYPENRE